MYCIVRGNGEVEMNLMPVTGPPFHLAVGSKAICNSIRSPYDFLLTRPAFCKNFNTKLISHGCTD